MRDKQLIKLVIATIIAQEAVAGIPGTPVKQAFQPTQQGVNTKPTAYIHKIASRRTGYPQRSDTWDANAGKMIHVETQNMETTFQVSALALQDPKQESQLTASDILDSISYILQSEATIEALMAQEVGVLKINDGRESYFKDEQDRFEVAPSFDFVLTHKRIVSSENRVLSSTRFEAYKV